MINLNDINTDFLKIKYLITLYLEPINIAINEQDKYYEILKTKFIDEIEKSKKNFNSLEEFQPYYENFFYLEDLTLINLKYHNFNSLVLLIYSNLESLLKTIIEEEYTDINLKKLHGNYLENYVKLISEKNKINNYKDIDSYKIILKYKKLRNIIVHNNSILCDTKTIEAYKQTKSLKLCQLNENNKYKVFIIDSLILKELVLNSIKLIEYISK